MADSLGGTIAFVVSAMLSLQRASKPNAILEKKKSTPTTVVVRLGVAAHLFDPITRRMCLGQRKGSHGAGDYCCPGGHLEMGESFNVCAARELFEETGVNIDPSRFFQFHVTNDRIEANKHYVTVHMGVEWDGAAEPQNLEPTKCGGWKWANLDEIRALLAQSKLFTPMHNLIRSGHLDRFFCGACTFSSLSPSPPPLPDFSHRVIFLSGFPGSGKGTQVLFLSIFYFFVSSPPQTLEDTHTHITHTHVFPLTH